MAMNADTLSDGMLAALTEPADEAIINKLGDAMFDAMLTVIMNQDSDPDYSLGRARFRKVARMMIDNFFVDISEPDKIIPGEILELFPGDFTEGPPTIIPGAPGTNKSRFQAFAQAIITEIQERADILSLSTTSTPAGTGPHIHSPATVKSTGKIR